MVAVQNGVATRFTAVAPPSAVMPAESTVSTLSALKELRVIPPIVPARNGSNVIAAAMISFLPLPAAIAQSLADTVHRLGRRQLKDGLRHSPVLDLVDGANAVGTVELRIR